MFSDALKVILANVNSFLLQHNYIGDSVIFSDVFEPPNV